MATTIPKKPTLNKLKGNLLLTDEKRKKYDINEDLLLNEARDWNNGKKVIDSYLKAAGDDWIESADDFVMILIDSFDKLADERNKYNGQDGLLQNYCSSLKTFYKNENMKNKLKKIYCCKALTKKIKINERELVKQSKSAMLVLTREQGHILEEEAEERMSLKRRAEDKNEVDRSSQRIKHTDEEQKKLKDKEQEETVVDKSFSSLDSFDSLERHPKSQYYYNYFVSDKKEKWSINNDNSWISSSGFNLSEAMYLYRCESYRAARLLYSISPERILSLSFIFIFNPNNIQGFICNCESEIDFIKKELEIFKQRSIPNEAITITNNLDNLRNKDSERNHYMATTHALYWNENLEMTTYYNITNSFHQHTANLHDYHTEQDHGSYEFFTKEIFKSNVYVKHKMSKHLTGCVDYIPDYKLAFEYQHGRFADLFVIEVKKDKKEYTPDTDDMVKIHLELQIMLNELILLNVIEPVVYGMVIQEHNCTLFQMTLKQEGQYISNIVDSFYLPRNMIDISLIPRVASIFLSLKDMVDDMINKLKNRSKRKSELVSFMKQGMSLPCPIKNPFKFCDEYNEHSCQPPM